MKDSRVHSGGDGGDGGGRKEAQQRLGRREYKDMKRMKEIQELEKRIEMEMPPHGVNPFIPSHMKHKAERRAKSGSSSSNSGITGGESDQILLDEFSKYPISKRTLRGLEKANYVRMTEIQQLSLLHSLGGRDVLGAARTGSGKTLAFLIPVLELLYRRLWTRYDGLGALILSPSRELALQIFEVLRTIGRNHSFSAGLLVGGVKNFKEEARHIGGMNVLVATPGRLLQHMDQTPGFITDNLQILVLDEADRLLEMGFSTEVNAILEHLPKQRQTLMFSATQTRSVKDLARLALNKENTEYVSTVEMEVVPRQLVQNYIQCELYDKVDILFSFLKSHPKSKTIVFVSTTKQAQYLHETFKRINVGITLCMLYGSMSQKKRQEYYETFVTKRAAVLFATDLASRGLDFPQVEFVFAMDVPISVESYIHRVGRTARLKATGKAITMVMPQEVELLKILEEKRGIVMKEMKVNPEKIVSIKTQLAAILSNDVKVKFLAMRYFESYLQHLAKNTALLKVDIDSLNLDEFAERLGLLEKPKVKLSTKRKEDATSVLEEKLKKAALETKGRSIVLDTDLDGVSDSSSSSDEDDDGFDDDDGSGSDDESDDSGGDDESDDSDDEQEGDDSDIGIDLSDLDSDDLDAISDISELERQIAELSSDDSDSDSDGDSDSDSDVEDDSESEGDVSEDSESEKEDDSDEDLHKLLVDKPKKKIKSQVEKMLDRKNLTVYSKKYKELAMGDSEDEVNGGDEDFFVVKRKDHELEDGEDDLDDLAVHDMKKAKAKHVLFDSEGKKITKFDSVVQELRESTQKEVKSMQADFKREIAERLKQADEEDKRIQREIMRNRKKKLMKEKQEEQELIDMVKKKERELREEAKRERKERKEREKIKRQLAEAVEELAMEDNKEADEDQDDQMETAPAPGSRKRKHAPSDTEEDDDDDDDDQSTQRSKFKDKRKKRKKKKNKKKDETDELQEDESLALALLGGGL